MRPCSGACTHRPRIPDGTVFGWRYASSGADVPGLKIRRGASPWQGALQGGGPITQGSMEILRLSCSTFYVDVRLIEIDGRWIASADTPGGPSLGLGLSAPEAIEAALEPFGALADELLGNLGL
jgi:hypothetical protein